MNLENSNAGSPLIGATLQPSPRIDTTPVYVAFALGAAVYGALIYGSYRLAKHLLR